MAIDDRTRAWFHEQRDSLLRQLQLLQSGTLTTGEKTASDTSWIDTTQRDIDRTRRQLGEVDAILSRHPSG